jgi:hypothetical protein
MFEGIKKFFTKQVEVEIEDNDYDLLGEEEWEDEVAVDKIKAKHPGWYLVKALDFSYRDMEDMEQWCVDNCFEEYELVGWNSGCSYVVGVIFKAQTDAVLFKLQYSGV